MIRITFHEDAATLTMQLEGKLTGHLVQEAETSWRQTVAAGRKLKLRIDLTGVTLIDGAGRDFLAAARAQGAELVASGCLMRAIVQKLTGGPLSDCGCPQDLGGRIS